MKETEVNSIAQDKMDMNKILSNYIITSLLDTKQVYVINNNFYSKSSKLLSLN